MKKIKTLKKSFLSPIFFNKSKILVILCGLMKIVGIEHIDNSGVNNVICIISTYIYKYLRQNTSHNALLRCSVYLYIFAIHNFVFGKYQLFPG